MAINSDTKLSAAELRNFGLMMGAVIGLLFGLVLPWLMTAGPAPIWPWIAAVLFISWAVIHPASLRPVYRVWMKFGHLMNSITTPVILAILFYLVLLPIGALMRLTGQDPIDKRLHGAAGSYRVDSSRRNAASMERPF